MGFVDRVLGRLGMGLDWVDAHPLPGFFLGVIGSGLVFFTLGALLY